MKKLHSVSAVLQTLERVEHTREEVQASRTRIDSRERRPILVQAVVRCHDPPDHIVYALNGHTAVVDRSGQVATEVGVSGLGESDSAWHVHVETCEDRGDASVCRFPIRHH